MKLLELRLQDLILLEPSLAESAVEKFYCRVLIAYFQCDVPALTQLVVDAPIGQSKEFHFFYQLAQLRLAIRKRAVTAELLAATVALLTNCDSAALRGEVCFVMALAYDVMKEHFQCLKWNYDASLAFAEAGLEKKSLLAQQNSVAAESRIFPNKNLLLQYYQVYRRARRGKHLAIAGIALFNIAREYQLVGALENALSAIDRSLAYMQGEEGTLHYYLALLNRAHILAELGRKTDAILDYEAASLGDFPEIRAARTALAHILGITTPAIANGTLTASWMERLEKNQNARMPLKKLSTQENSLVRILSAGARERHDLAAELFGSNISLEHALNRLKSLLTRLARKTPGLICQEEERIFLATEFNLEKDSA
jgi:tetratricopeptide (TPR) repeat protein